MKKCLSIVLILALLFSLTGCSLPFAKKDPLDPSKPVTIVVWHYYNGHIKEKFDSLVNQFNETVGVERGIVVDAQSIGDVQKLADTVFESANKTIGSSPMPDIFAAYPDNAYRVHQITPLVDLNTYFSKEDTDLFYPGFLADAKFPEDDALRIIPVAKSTENLFVNNTVWEPFAKANQLKNEDLSTWEGLYQVAKFYHEKTGKSFLGIDGNANFMLMSSLQLGINPYDYKNGKTDFTMTKEVAHHIWDYFYKPYIEGYYVKTGRFSSDDAKTGTVLAYTGSTAGAAYFPKEIVHENSSSTAIDALVMPYPYFSKGKPYAISQGAGMCITVSDTPHEYASSVFLKWFTAPEQNLNFAVSTGYFPVSNDAIKPEVIKPALESLNLNSPVIEKTMNATLKMFSEYTLYNNSGFNGSFDMRVLLERHLKEKVDQDLLLLKDRIAKGDNKAEVVSSLISEASFEAWYSDLLSQSKDILSSK